MKTLINPLVILLLSGTLAAQDQADEMMYNAYLSEKPAPEVWKAAIVARKEVWRKGPDQVTGLQLALAQLGLLSSTMRYKDEDLFDEYYKDTEENLEAIISANKKWAEPLAILSATYGLKMGYSPVQGMFLGPKSGNLIEKAKALDPSSAWFGKSTPTQNSLRLKCGAVISRKRLNHMRSASNCTTQNPEH